MSEEGQSEEPLAPYVIEGARSGRSRCKSCRRKIDAGALRLGMLVDGHYGPGYVWQHLRCAARRQLARVVEAYEARAWEAAKEPLEESDLPPLEQLREEAAKAEQKRAVRRELPYAELAPSGRSRCKHSGEPIELGAARVVLGRAVEFGRQTRTAPINVLPEYVAAELNTPECDTPAEGFLEALRTNSVGLEPGIVEEIVERIGELPGQG